MFTTYKYKNMQNYKSLGFISVFFMLALEISAQAGRWQQRVDYQMWIDFDHKTHTYQGKQRLVYQNNSPDTLKRVFYHLYFNAFQPGSSMDVRSQVLPDPDKRVMDRISKLQEKEIGYQRILTLSQDGDPVTWEIAETILEVTLHHPILPGSSTVLEMEHQAQVPVQIRRSGRDNAEGIDYSMAQWYPKLCEYDDQGWHANPYIAREFYGVWGSFEVFLTIDRDFTVAASGYLQNAPEIGHGFTSEANEKGKMGRKNTWHFIAPNVHDFVWAADEDYTHTRLMRKDGTELHFFYVENERNRESWAQLPGVMDVAFDYINANFGQYPYRQYSFIMAGDGGMEYAMATLITGNRPIRSLTGVAVHELMHSWYQMVLGTNESLFAWMDEGFTSYASTRVMDHLTRMKLLEGKPAENPFAGTYTGYINLTKSGLEEPLSTHADHFMTNYGYGLAAYTKGEVFLNQLEYIVGKAAFDRSLLQYFKIWQFKHPQVNDFIRVFEKEADLELDWYKEYWVNSVHTIDYGIDSVYMDQGKTIVRLERLGQMPMPVDVQIKRKNGQIEVYVIPLELMRGAKVEDDLPGKMNIAPDWPWVMPYYTLELPYPNAEISSIEIDGSKRMADVERSNNLKLLDH